MYSPHSRLQQDTSSNQKHCSGNVSSCSHHHHLCMNRNRKAIHPEKSELRSMTGWRDSHDAVQTHLQIYQAKQNSITSPQVCACISTVELVGALPYLMNEQVNFIENGRDVGIQCMRTCMINLPEGGVRIVGFTTPTTHYPMLATYMCGASF